MSGLTPSSPTQPHCFKQNCLDLSDELPALASFARASFARARVFEHDDGLRRQLGATEESRIQIAADLPMTLTSSPGKSL